MSARSVPPGSSVFTFGRAGARAAVLLALFPLAQPVVAQSGDDGRWLVVPNGPNSGLEAVASFGGDVYVGGFFTLAGGSPISAVARYDGVGFHPLGTGLEGGRGGGAPSVSSFFLTGATLAVGGSFQGVGGLPTNSAALWNGSSWTALPGIGTPGERLTAWEQYQGSLIGSAVVLGQFIRRWDGSSWTTLGSDFVGSSLSDVAFDLQVFQGDLVAGGGFLTAGGAPAAHLARWNGASWSPLGGGANDTVHALAIHDGALIVAGDFTSAGGMPASRIARWDGSHWSTLGSGMDRSVFALAVLHGKLFAGGQFNSAGGVPASGVAQWNGTSWAPLGSGTAGSPLGGVRALCAHGDRLVVGGSFSSAGGQPTQNLAFWNDPLDETPPTVVIDAPQDGARVAGTSVLLAATIEDEGATTVSSTPVGVTASLPAGGGQVSGSVPLADEGPNLLIVHATDESGNVGQNAVTIVRDTRAPMLEILTPPEGSVLGTDEVTLTVTVMDASASVLTLGAASFPVPAGGGTVTATVPLVEGSHAILVLAVDAVGNTASVTRGVVVDLTAPAVTMLTPPSSPMPCFGPGEAQVVVSADVQDSTATDVLFAPGGASGSLPPGGGQISRVVSLAEGTNTIEVCATDATGSTGCVARTAILDTTAPLVAFASPTYGSAVRQVVDLEVEASDPLPGSGVAGVELFLDGAPTPFASFTGGPYEMLLDTNTLADGTHTLVARATDGKGNVAYSAPLALRVDNRAPTLTILTPAEGEVVSGTLAALVLVEDTGTGVTSAVLQANGTPPAPLDPSFVDAASVPSALLEAGIDTTSLADGALTLAVQAVDEAGNTASATRHVVVDNSVPPVCALSPADGALVAGTLVLQAQVSGLFDTLELRVDGALVAGPSGLAELTSPFDTRTRLDGPMRIEARVRYGAGQELVCVSDVLVDNLTVELNPAVLNLSSNGQAPIHARVEGPSAGLLLPTEAHALQLRVCNGSPVLALSGWPGDDALSDTDRDGSPELQVRFERRALANVIQAGLACGDLQRGALIEVELWASTTPSAPATRLGSALVRLVGNP